MTFGPVFETGSMTGLINEKRRHSRIMTNFKIYTMESRPYGSRRANLSARSPGVRRPSGPECLGGRRPAMPVSLSPSHATLRPPLPAALWTSGAGCGMRAGLAWSVGSTRYSPPTGIPPSQYPTYRTLPHCRTAAHRRPSTATRTCTYDRFRYDQGDPRGG